MGNYFLIRGSNESVGEVRGHGGIEKGAYPINTSEIKQMGLGEGALRPDDVMKHGSLSRRNPEASMGMRRRQRLGRGQNRQTLSLLVAAQSLDSVEHGGALSSLQLSTSVFRTKGPDVSGLNVLMSN